MKITAIVSFPVLVEIEVEDETSTTVQNLLLIKEGKDWLEWARPWDKSPEPIVTITKSEPGFTKPYRGRELPKVGDIIYVPTKWYIDRGEDDVEGGRARVTEVKGTFVSVKEHPGSGYNWDCLMHQQEKLEKEFGIKWAYPDPDN